VESNGPGRQKFRNKKNKIWMDWSHVKKRGWGNTKGRLTVESSRKEEDLRIAGEDRLSKKRVEAGMNDGS
jgi:hypothetical protein